MKLSEMPVVTVEQIMRFRQAAMAVEQRLDDVRKMYDSQCQLTDDILQQKAELLAAARFGVSNLSAYGQDACDLVIRVLEKAIAKAGEKQ